MHAPNTNITRFLNFNSNDPLRPRNMKSTKWQTSQGGEERQHLSTVEDVNRLYAEDSNLSPIIITRKTR